MSTLLRRLRQRRAVTYRCRYCRLRLRFSGPNAEHEALAAIAWHHDVCTVFPRPARDHTDDAGNSPA